MKTYLLTAAILTLGSASLAQPLILPEVFAVSGVAANDTLNVRQAPSGSSADIGDLYPNQLVEVIALNDNEQWGQIIWQEGNGWISMQYLATVQRPRMHDSVMPLGISCSGSEPFWLAQFQPDQTLAFTDYSLATQTTLTQPIQHSASAINMPPFSFAFTAGAFTGLLERAQCSDGMSDIKYGWQLSLMSLSGAGLQLRKGCCRTAN